MRTPIPTRRSAHGKKRRSLLRRRGWMMAPLALLLMGLPAVAQPSVLAPTRPIPDAQLALAPTPVDAELEALQQAAEAATVEKDALHTEVEQLRERRERVEDSLHRRARALYRMRRAGMLPVAGGFDAMLSHLGRMKRLERMVQGDLRSVAYLDRRATALEGAIADAEREAELKARQLEQLAEQRRLEAGRARTADLFADLVDPSVRLPVTAQGNADGYGLRVHGAQQVRFDAQRGRLRLPVAAGGAVRDATREDGSGLEFVARAGARVEVVSEGRVAFARRYGVYGTMVVIDHGDGYFTVYAGLARLDVTAGEPVVLGQTLGAVGNDPLYFEIRRGTRSLDPHEWVGI
ncbi:MAG: peptidoglycan DD-metalloendopeptidase family protein [Deltaproteobacteria bacterium]|nr:peptidoglycan DD-metalloendopeptidase family protein [Deltaproteobacteria bacterium]